MYLGRRNNYEIVKNISKIEVERNRGRGRTKKK